MNTRKFFPKTFFWQITSNYFNTSIIITVSFNIFFYERHWDDVGRRLALALGGQISYIIKTLEEKVFSLMI